MIKTNSGFYKDFEQVDREISHFDGEVKNVRIYVIPDNLSYGNKIFMTWEYYIQ